MSDTGKIGINPHFEKKGYLEGSLIKGLILDSFGFEMYIKKLEESEIKDYAIEELIQDLNSSPDAVLTLTEKNGGNFGDAVKQLLREKILDIGERYMKQKMEDAGRPIEYILKNYRTDES